MFYTYWYGRNDNVLHCNGNSDGKQRRQTAQKITLERAMQLVFTISCAQCVQGLWKMQPKSDKYESHHFHDWNLIGFQILFLLDISFQLCFFLDQTLFFRFVQLVHFLALNLLKTSVWTNSSILGPAWSTMSIVNKWECLRAHKALVRKSEIYDLNVETLKPVH